MPINSIFPSTQRRRTPEETERGEFNSEPEEIGGSYERVGISATTLSRATHCLLRAVWASRGAPGIAPSPFTQAIMEDGNAFEAALFKNPSLWVRAINQVLRMRLPEDLPVINCKGVRLTKDQCPETLIQRTVAALAAFLPADRSLPFALTQATLASMESGTLLQGQPDILLWTGSEWLICDVKCSEEARRSHGIQISAYARMLRAMWPDDPLHSSGVVIHCANGYRFTADSTATAQATTLGLTQATAFPLDALEPTVGEIVALLSGPPNQTLARALELAVFSPACNECTYRHRCYPRFLEARHVSLLPLMKAELQSIIDAGIRTIDDLIHAIDNPDSAAYATLLELKDDSPLQLGFLRQKAVHVLERGLYSCWRAPAPSLEKPLFFVAVGDQSCFEPKLNPDSCPSCLVVYTESERRRAWAQLLQDGRRWNIPTYILSQEVQQTVHGPLPSLTLRPLAAILNEKVTRSHQYFLSLYPAKQADHPERFDRILQQETTADERMMLLKLVWSFLMTASIPFTINPASEPA